MDRRDIHILRYFSSFVSVSQGRVINVTEPAMIFCPLASHLYKDFKRFSGRDKGEIKDAIRKAIESKIKDYGFFTDNRRIAFEDTAIPYGASEMVGFALKKKTVQAAVLVCEGAGTVIVDKPDVAQGIGARMNSLLLTSPIEGIIKKLNDAACRVVFENALIDQVRGVEEAIKAGYKDIAVTVCGHSAEDLKALRLLEKKNGIDLVILAVCTTGIAKDKIETICDYVDLVWSCASFDVRRIIGPSSILQLSLQIPVFVLTKKGTGFIPVCAQGEKIIKNLDIKKQYLVSNEPGGQSIHLGGVKAYISEASLPVSSRKEPVFKDEGEYAAA
ncbi:MAG: DUF2099 family protein [Candidatus Omnitrophica bacterium]|nr:DUF2099 family protein [Candidatus Omnitrophota bacterium]